MNLFKFYEVYLTSFFTFVIRPSASKYIEHLMGFSFVSRYCIIIQLSLESFSRGQNVYESASSHLVIRVSALYVFLKNPKNNLFNKK